MAGVPRLWSGGGTSDGHCPLTVHVSLLEVSGCGVNLSLLPVTLINDRQLTLANISLTFLFQSPSLLSFLPPFFREWGGGGGWRYQTRVS